MGFLDPLKSKVWFWYFYMIQSLNNYQILGLVLEVRLELIISFWF